MLEGRPLKKILTVVILAALVLASFNIIQLPHASAQTNQAQVLSYSWYLAPSTTTTAEYINDLVCVGEVQNTGSNVIGKLFVIGQAFDSNGVVLDASEAQVFVNNLAPNQKAPFYIDFTPENSITQDQSWVSNMTSLTVQMGAIINATGTQYTGLTTSNLNGLNTNGVYTVTGTIQNTGDQGIGDVAVVTTFYNSTGSVVALNFTDVGSALAIGQATTFSVTPQDNTAALSNEIASYAILLQSVPAPTATATPNPTAVPTAQPTSFPNGSNSNPTQNSGSQSSILIYIIVIVAVAVALIAVVGFVLLRRPVNRQ
jgi:hypothetical protein